MPPLEAGSESVLNPVVRPLQEGEKRLLRWATIRERRGLAKASPFITLMVGTVLFGGLWGLTILATRADRRGLSWQMSGLIWLGIGVAISLWSYRETRKYAGAYSGRFASALKMDKAVEIRIKAKSVIAIEWGNKPGPTYAFQIEDDPVADNRIPGDQSRDDQIVFFSFARGRFIRGFPSTDFSVVDLFDEKIRPVFGYVRVQGQELEAAATISAPSTAGLRPAEHLEIMPGKLSELEMLISKKRE